MNNEIRNIFGDDIANSTIEHIVKCLDKMNLTPEQIAEYIGKVSETTRALIHIKALLDGNEELADKISKAIEFIELKRIDEFKKSVANGTHEDFFANMTWPDKCSLSADMGLFRTGIPGEKPLTEDEEEALSQDFASVEDWKTYNADNAECRMGIETQTGMNILLHEKDDYKR